MLTSLIWYRIYLLHHLICLIVLDRYLSLVGISKLLGWHQWSIYQLIFWPNDHWPSSRFLQHPLNHWCFRNASLEPPITVNTLCWHWVDMPYSPDGGIDYVEVLHPIMHATGYVRCPCKGHGIGCLWLLLLLPLLLLLLLPLNPKSGVTSDIKITDTDVFDGEYLFVSDWSIKGWRLPCPGVILKILILVPNIT